MKQYRLGFIGMGNMGTAIADGCVRYAGYAPEALLAYAPNQEKLRGNAAKIGFTPCEDAHALCALADVVVLACKPYQMEAVLADLAPFLAQKAVLSIALGWDFQKLQAHLPADSRVQFVMPNTPAAVGAGVFLFEEATTLTKAERAALMELFGKFGLVRELPTALMGIGGALCGCGPAFVDLFLEALADAAVRYGMPRQTAYALASQTVLGSAQLQLATGEHPGVLKDQVCSPGGSTIRGVDALEHAAFRAAVADAITAAMGK